MFYIFIFTFRKMRKLAQRKNGFPQNAEAHPDEKRLSAKCGSSPRRKTAFRKMRKLAQRKNGFPQNAEVRPEKKQLSAKCGSPPRRKTAFRILRKINLNQKESSFFCRIYFKFTETSCIIYVN